MAGRNGQELLSAWVPSELAASFRASARAERGGASAALRSLIVQATTGQPQDAPAGSGTGYRLTVRLRERERQALLSVSQALGVTPSTWVRALAIVHLSRRPQWNDTEVQELRKLFVEVRRIGNNVNQIAHALNIAALSGDCPPDQGKAALEAIKLLRSEMQRIVAVMTGNFDYWGLPSDERPRGSMDAALLEDDEARAAKRRIRLRPRRRPKRFEDSLPSLLDGKY